MTFGRLMVYALCVFAGLVVVFLVLPKVLRLIHQVLLKLRYAICVILLLAGIGATYQAIESSREEREPPHGRLVDVGGHEMHLDCEGQGAPTVILESGLWDDSIVWHNVQPEIAKLTRVCSYDRAGLGYSDPRPDQVPDSRNIVRNLHMLLASAGVLPPYVLVGHSLGGIHIRVYQNLHPSDVVGMVLVDSEHPDQESRLPPEMNKIQSGLYLKSKLWGLAVPLGIPRLLGLCGVTVDCHWQTVKTREAEAQAIGASADEARHTGSLDSIPLVVVSHDPEKGATPGLIPPEVSQRFEEQWVQMQEELARLSTNGSRVVAIGSTHYVQIDRGDLVIDAIQKVLDAARFERLKSWIKSQGRHSREEAKNAELRKLLFGTKG